ncbi:MAG: hypothetical protein A3G94_02500 [Deltaproteobacteria bacterium RIFCSPLOWO2_12_FULL_60_16]|nr:MAG: hypothetical protein A3G94_02500 [Deltaproteobacteria bacterium RIFCSPLOWO2_12_FULL_60_16]
MEQESLLNNRSRVSGIRWLRGWIIFPLYLSITLTFGALASAQESFYKGKTIRIVVGFAPGGGFDWRLGLRPRVVLQGENHPHRRGIRARRRV